MRLAILILAIAATNSFAAEKEQFIKVPSEKVVEFIIPDDYASKNLTDYFGKEVTGFWTPTLEQVKIAEQSVSKSLRGSDHSSFLRYYPRMSEGDRARALRSFEEESLPFIMKNYGDYSIQFVGLIVNGKKRILCHYALYTDAKVFGNVYWMGPSDSGADFWTVQFDPESQICFNYSDMGNA